MTIAKTIEIIRRNAFEEADGNSLGMVGPTRVMLKNADAMELAAVAEYAERCRIALCRAVELLPREALIAAGYDQRQEWHALAKNPRDAALAKNPATAIPGAQPAECARYMPGTSGEPDGGPPVAPLTEGRIANISRLLNEAAIHFESFPGSRDGNGMALLYRAIEEVRVLNPIDLIAPRVVPRVAAERAGWFCAMRAALATVRSSRSIESAETAIAADLADAIKNEAPEEGR